MYLDVGLAGPEGITLLLILDGRWQQTNKIMCLNSFLYKSTAKIADGKVEHWHHMPFKRLLVLNSG